MEKYYCNFKRYTKKNRLSLFSREKDGKLEIFILKANNKENFDKDLARGIYEEYLKEGIITNKKQQKIVVYQHFINDKPHVYHPEIILVPIEEGNSPKYQFNLFTKQNFLRKKIIFVPKEILV